MIHSWKYRLFSLSEKKKHWWVLQNIEITHIWDGSCDYINTEHYRRNKDLKTRKGWKKEKKSQTSGGGMMNCRYFCKSRSNDHKKIKELVSRLVLLNFSGWAEGGRLSICVPNGCVLQGDHRTMNFHRFEHREMRC